MRFRNTTNTGLAAITAPTTLFQVELRELRFISDNTKVNPITNTTTEIITPKSVCRRRMTTYKPMNTKKLTSIEPRKEWHMAVKR